MKKTLVSALTTALVVGAASTTFAASNPFSDVPADHWAYDAVSQLAADGVIDGYGDSTFKGNRNITRYEMAQMVAKAMAKNTSGADKALVDKLAAEFAAELNNLGVRVANLERNADMVKWNGQARYTFSRTSGDNDSTSKNEFLFRLEPSAEVNSHWHVKARLDATNNAKTDNTSNVSLKRIWAEGKYGNFTVKLGKFGSMNGDSIADTQFSGAEVSYGKDIKGIVGAGRISMEDIDSKLNATALLNGTSANYHYVGVEAKKKKLSGGLYWHHISRSNLSAGLATAGVYGTYSDDAKDEFNLLAVKGAYRFDKNVAVQGFYAQNRNADYYKKAGAIEVDYKGAQQENKGTWGAWVAYRHIGAYGVVAPTWDAIGRNQKGWEIGGNYTIFKNVVATLRYGNNKDLNGGAKEHKYFGRVQFFF